MKGHESRIVVLTGATRGLGRAMARKFASLGHTVLGCGRDEAALRALRKELPAPHDFEALDVTDEAQVAAWARRLLAAHGPPDLLLNNAALCNRPAPLWKVPADEFSRVVDVNLKGMACVVRHFVPAMVARKKGVIVNFSSGWGRSTSPEVAPYCATKWAVEGLTQALAEELPRGMAAVPLNPGIIHTDMLETCFGAREAAGYPPPERWAERAVPFLLSIGAGENGRPLTAP
jgi:NAD(P)-dependent dehydrogenase (short-subunit alcohol dehydrogenase family)